MKFFKTIQDSIFNRSFYRNLFQTQTKNSLKYFLKLSLLITVVTATWTTISMAPSVLNTLSRENLVSIADKYPADLRIDLKNGEVTTNLTEEPYFIKNDQPPKTSGSKENIFVIDTKNSFDIEKFKSLSTHGLLTKYYLVVEEENGKITIQDLSKVPNLSISRGEITKWIDVITPFTKFVIPMIFVLLFVFIFISISVGYCIYLFVGALFVMLVGKFKKVKTSYWQGYRIGLHAITLPLILSAILPFIGLRITLPWLTVILIIVCIVNIEKGATEAQAPIIPPSATPTV